VSKIFIDSPYRAKQARVWREDGEHDQEREKILHHALARVLVLALPLFFHDHSPP
jgi:hypothetical protein